MIKYIKVVNKKTGKVFARVVETKSITFVEPITVVSDSLNSKAIHFRINFADGSSLSIDSLGKFSFENFAYFLASTESIRLIID